ncbi:MAG: CDP-glucose 4,6-dehydratase [Chitinophagales bacterium]|jgi:CDP-glucose 4,6-dehydratase|nr:CDP-glucose 4,6-dehydratase [Chitinophagales bacterium]
MQKLFNGIYKDKVVLLTGHTGFKGSWLALWLHQLGAKVVGFSKDIPTTPSHWQVLNLPIVSIIGDIRSQAEIENAIKEHQPDIIFHLAAQALVRYSYKNDLETFTTNIIGTANMLHTALKFPSIKAFVNITSDKAYENKEWIFGYRENDPMGGHDPYSASKGCAELVTASYRNSYFQHTEKLLASARAGNVIGGGDWAEDRLIPDIFKATAAKQTAIIRNPNATRPWQHVLEPLSGYLLLGQNLLEGNATTAEAWNFGPDDEATRTVLSLAETITKNWKDVAFEIATEESNLHEANLLKLDCSKSNFFLNWKPVWDFEQTILYTTNWYKDYLQHKIENTAERSLDDLKNYIKDARNKNINWTQ